ncbi:hypothetical protein Pla52o_15660 [Novipirellula galeiformis]|uniref:Uncharacterized protein n=1 Tax=Novipirellula galeiformis TaxID=2528004 RepID=A0A5C6CLD7_9BACT|nr:hypothetical protein Pla52o_15660 [Novipirellula galeiformis]
MPSLSKYQMHSVFSSVCLLGGDWLLMVPAIRAVRTAVERQNARQTHAMAMSTPHFKHMVSGIHFQPSTQSLICLRRGNHPDSIPIPT